ncbi:MAG: hypothetical protein AB7E51_07915 [Pseudodesulfovibrio sp.]|uniref:hypothetical protein n=1 Tax=Pseudodesulfovibrio sp. TaxID=2035812 RepID=UPI003D10DDD8
MNEQHNAVSRTHRFKPNSLVFIDAFASTYGLSKSAVVNFAVLNMKTMLEGAAKDDPRNGARIGTAMSIQAQTLD